MILLKNPLHRYHHGIWNMQTVLNNTLQLPALITPSLHAYQHDDAKVYQFIWNINNCAMINNLYQALRSGTAQQNPYLKLDISML